MAERYFEKKEKTIASAEDSLSITPLVPVREEGSENKRAAKLLKDKGDHLTATYWG